MDSLSNSSLPSFSWIGHLKEDDRQLLSSYGEFFPGHPGNVLVQEGVELPMLFVVITGQLEVHARQQDNSLRLLARVGPGETIGEVNLFSPGPATATVTVTEFSQLWRIHDNDLINFIEENPGAGNVVLRNLAMILAQRLRTVDPTTFGMSAYGVVDTPETPDVPELVEETDTSFTEAPAETRPAVVAPPVTLPTLSAPPDQIANAPRSTVTAPPKTAPKLPVPREAQGPLNESQPLAPAEKMATKSKRTDTQTFPDPDDLEPLI
jgi:CRP-like cAMP-binding protein